MVRRPCGNCDHGVTKHRDRLADQTADSRQTDRNTSCRECGCPNFCDAGSDPYGDDQYHKENEMTETHLTYFPNEIVIDPATPFEGELTEASEETVEIDDRPLSCRSAGAFVLLSEDTYKAYDETTQTVVHDDIWRLWVRGGGEQVMVRQSGETNALFDKVIRRTR